MIPPAHTHGGDGVRVARALGLDPGTVLDLSASLNPVAPDIATIVAGRLDALGRYPDPTAATEALAAALGAGPERVLLTNGGAEAIALVGQALGGEVEEPEFSLHPRGGGPRWRSDPHNPTGVLAAPGDRADVWDEAFYALATGRWTAGRDAVVVGSLTKLFACPGLRLGYVLVPPERVPLLDHLRTSQPAWAVNGLAAAALPALLERADLPRWAAAIGELRRQLLDVLSAHGLGPLPSHANYVLCQHARGLRGRLAPTGVVVRDCASFGLVDHARIAVPDGPGIERLANALEQTS